MADWVKALLAALLAVAVAAITLLQVFSIVTWSASQTSLAIAEATAAVGFLTALVAHLWPGTKKEPVALGGTFTALVAATLAVLSGFDVWKLTQDQVSALIGLVTAVIALTTALVARTKVKAEPQRKVRRHLHLIAH